MGSPDGDAAPAEADGAAGDGADDEPEPPHAATTNTAVAARARMRGRVCTSASGLLDGPACRARETAMPPPWAGDGIDACGPASYTGTNRIRFRGSVV